MEGWKVWSSFLKHDPLPVNQEVTSDKNSICLNHLQGGIDTKHTSHSFFTSVFIQVMEHRR